jgi:hypothetical protein
MLRHDPEKKQYVVRLDCGGCKVRVVIPESQIFGPNDEVKQKAALKKAKSVAKELYDTIPADGG